MHFATMRNALVAVSVFLLTACSALFPTPASPRPHPSPSPTHMTLTPTAAASAAPSLPADLVPFSAALLPEFQDDLAAVHAPTIYRINLRLDSSLSHLSGQESVKFTNRTPSALGEVYFRLFPNYPSVGSDKETVSSVKVEGKQVSPTLESQDTALRVPLAGNLPPGATATFELNFDVSIPVSSTIHYADFTDSGGIITLPSIYPLIPAYDEKGWHTEVPPPYGDLVYADVSLFDVNFTVPDTLTVIASGATVGTSTQGREKTWHLVGGPMRDFDINLSAVLQSTSGKVGQVTINSYYLPRDEQAGRNALDWASKALGVYEKRIGAYPFGELDVVETPTTAGGIEYPGLVVIASELYEETKQDDFFEFAVVHEVAHQWWYAQVGADQVNTPWMDEAFAQYTSFIYYQDTYGEGAGRQIQRNVFQSQYDEAKKNKEDEPVGLPVSAYTEKQYGEIVYGKGPLFFDAVRQQIGDDAFFRFMQSYYDEFKYRIAKPEDMLQVMNRVSGQQLGPLFNQWIEGK